MLKLCLLACMLGVPCCAAASSFQVAGDGSSPEMVRLSLGPTPASMLVQWTQNISACIPGSRGIVSFGLSAENLGQTASGNCTQWAEGNPSGIHFTFTVLLPDLAPRTKYFYRVAAASSSLCSPVFHFTSLTNDPNFNPNILFFGDLGHKGGAQALKLFTALPALIAEVHDPSAKPADLIIHMGDFAYDLQDEGGLRGDEFQRQIQNLSAYVPYMTCVGNHEDNFNYSNYRHRFSNPRSQINEGFDMWYSVDIGAFHLIFFSTEVLFYRKDTTDQQRQLEWLKRDLVDANSNRNDRPWLVTIGHRPMYCSNSDRDCLPFAHSAGHSVAEYVEDLFFDHGVDLELWAHEHSYERLFPTYKGSSVSDNYTNPKAPTHVISGAAGCNEDNGLCLNPILKAMGNWSAYRTGGIFHPYSYGHLSAPNSSTLLLDQVNSRTAKRFDSLTITQSHHGPFTGATDGR